MYVIPEKGSRIVDFFRLWNQILTAETYEELQKLKTSINEYRRALQAKSPWADTEKQFVQYLDLTVKWREHVDFGEHETVEFPPQLQGSDPNESLGKLENHLIFAHCIMQFPDGKKRLSVAEMENAFEQAQRLLCNVALTCQKTGLMLLLEERDSRDDIEQWVMRYTTLFIVKLLILRQHKVDEAKAFSVVSNAKSPIEFQQCMKSRSQDWVFRIDGILKRLNLTSFPTLRAYYQSQDQALSQNTHLESRLRVLSCYHVPNADSISTKMLLSQLTLRFKRLWTLHLNVNEWRSHQPNKPFLEGFLLSELMYQLKLLKSDALFLKEIRASVSSDPIDPFNTLLGQIFHLISIVESKKVDMTTARKLPNEETAFTTVIESLRQLTTDQYQVSDDFRPYQEQENRITEFFTWAIECLNLSSLEDTNTLKARIQTWGKSHSYKRLNDVLSAMIDWKFVYFKKGKHIRPHEKNVNEFLERIAKQRFPSRPLDDALSFHIHNLSAVLLIPPVKDQKPVAERVSILRPFVSNLWETARFIDDRRQPTIPRGTVSHSFVQQLNDAATVKIADRAAATIFEALVVRVNQEHVEFLIRLRLDCIQEQQMDPNSPNIRNSLYWSEACLRLLNLATRPDWRHEFLERDQIVEPLINKGKPVPACLMSVRLPNQRNLLLQQFDNMIRFYNATIYHPLLSETHDISINCQLIFQCFSRALFFDLILYIIDQQNQMPRTETDLALFEMMAALLDFDNDKIPTRYSNVPPPLTEFLKSREISDALLTRVNDSAIRFLKALLGPARSQWTRAEMQKLLLEFNSPSTLDSIRQNCLTALIELYFGLLSSCANTKELSDLIQSNLHKQMKTTIAKSPDSIIYESMLDYYQQCHAMKKPHGKYEKSVLLALGRPYYDACCRFATPSLLTNRLSGQTTGVLLNLLIAVSKLYPESEELKTKLASTLTNEELKTKPASILTESELILCQNMTRFKEFDYYPLFKPVVTPSLNPAASFEVETHPVFTRTQHRRTTRLPRARREDNQPRPPSILEPFEAVLDYWKNPQKTLQYYRQFTHQRDIKLALEGIKGMINCLPHLPHDSRHDISQQIIARSPYIFSQAKSRFFETDLATYRECFEVFYRDWSAEMEALAEKTRREEQSRPECKSAPEPEIVPAFEESDEEEDETPSSQWSSDDDTASPVTKSAESTEPAPYIPFQECKTDIVLDFELNQHESDICHFLFQNSGYTVAHAGAVTAAYFRKKRTNLNLLTFGNIKVLYERLSSLKTTLDIAHVQCNYLDKTIKTKSKPLIVVIFNSPLNSNQPPEKIVIYVRPFTCLQDLFLQLREHAKGAGVATVYYDLRQNCLLDPLNVRKALLRDFTLNIASECGIDLKAIMLERPEFIMEVFFILSYNQTIHSKYKLGTTLHENIQENKHLILHSRLQKKIPMTYFDKLFLRGYSLLTIVNLKNYLIVPFAFPHVHAKLLHYRLNRFLEFDLKVLSNPPFEIKAITEARSEIFYIIYTDLMLLACTLDTTINTQIDFDKVIVEQLSTCSFDIDGETINLLQNRWWIEFGADMISARAYTIPTMGL